MKRVLLTDKIADDAVKVLQSFGGIEAVSTGTPTHDELVAQIPEFDAVIVRSPTKVNAAVIAAGKRLKFIGRAGVGVDNIDVHAAQARGITVINSPRSNTVSSAEHTFALMLALARDIPRAHAMVTAGKWEREAFVGVELFGKTLGVVGLGRVGREVAMRARAFGMNVLASDPFVSIEQAKALGVVLVPMDDVLESADWVTVHVPLGESTHSLIGAPEIATMKPGVRIVNCARGGIVDERALAKALATGKVAGVALDVFEHEPPPADNPLLKDPRCIFTPHLGAATFDAQKRVATDVAESIGLALSKGEIRDAVSGG